MEKEEMKCETLEEMEKDEMSYEEKKGDLEYAWTEAFKEVVQIYNLGDTLSKSRMDKVKEIFDSIEDLVFDTEDYLKNNMKQ